MIWSLFKRYFNIMHTNTTAHRIPWYLNTQKTAIKYRWTQWLDTTISGPQASEDSVCIESGRGWRLISHTDLGIATDREVTNATTPSTILLLSKGTIKRGSMHFGRRSIPNLVTERRCQLGERIKFAFPNTRITMITRCFSREIAVFHVNAQD